MIMHMLPIVPSFLPPYRLDKISEMKKIPTIATIPDIDIEIIQLISIAIVYITGRIVNNNIQWTASFGPLQS